MTFVDLLIPYPALALTSLAIVYVCVYTYMYMCTLRSCLTVLVCYCKAHRNTDTARNQCTYRTLIFVVFQLGFQKHLPNQYTNIHMIQSAISSTVILYQLIVSMIEVICKQFTLIQTRCLNNFTVVTSE